MKKAEKLFYGLLVVAFPLLLFLNIYQVYRTQKLEKEIGVLEEQRNDLVETNRQMNAAIALISSPQRVGALTDNSDDEEDLKDPLFITVGQE